MHCMLVVECLQSSVLCHVEDAGCMPRSLETFNAGLVALHSSDTSMSMEDLSEEQLDVRIAVARLLLISCKCCGPCVRGRPCFSRQLRLHKLGYNNFRRCSQPHLLSPFPLLLQGLLFAQQVSRVLAR